MPFLLKFAYRPSTRLMTVLCRIMRSVGLCSVFQALVRSSAWGGSPGLNIRVANGRSRSHYGCSTGTGNCGRFQEVKSTVHTRTTTNSLL